MKMLNWRWLALVASVTLVSAGAIHLLHGHQVRKSAAVFRDEATRARQKDRPDQAIGNLQAYLRLVPTDVGARAELGLLLADTGQHDRAYRTLEEVLRQSPGRLDVRRRLVGVLLELERYADAEEHLGKHLLPRLPADAELREMAGQCREAFQDYQSAAAAYRRAVELEPSRLSAYELEPSRLSAYELLANVLRDRLDRPDEADQWMERLVESNPDSLEAHLVRGEYALKTGAPSVAEAEASRALAIAPADLRALRLAANSAIALSKHEEARQFASKAVSLHERDPRAYMMLADVEVRTSSRDAAIECLGRGVSACPGDGMLLWNLANLLLDAGRLDEAEQEVKQLEKIDYAKPLVAVLGTRIKYGRGNWLAASQGFEENRAALTAWPEVQKQVDCWLGDCYQQLGNVDLQLAAYRRAVEANPAWTAARLGIASALTRMGRIAEAIEEYGQLMRLPGAPARGWTELGRLLVLNNLSEARDRRDWKEVEDIVARARRSTPESHQVAVLEAEAFAAQNRLQEAGDVLNKAAARWPDQADIVSARVELLNRMRRPDAADKVLRDAESRLGDRFWLRLARARHCFRSSGSAAQSQVRSLAENASSFPKDERVLLWRGLAAIALALDDFEQAKLLCDRLRAEEPANLGIRLLAFDLALMSRDIERIEQLLQDIGRIEGQGPLLHYGAALKLMLSAESQPEGRQDRLAETVKHLSLAEEQRPTWSRIALLSGQVHDQRGEEDVAINDYLRAIDLGERSPGAVRRLVKLLRDRRRYLDADRVIRRVEDQATPLSLELSRMAADISLRLEDFDRALEVARRAAEGSKNHDDHTWLGQVRGAHGQHAKAEGRDADAEAMFQYAEADFRKGVELNRQSADTWVPLILFLNGIGQTAAAEKAIAEAQREIPRQDAPLAVAQCFEGMGRLPQAEEQYLAALAATPDSSVVLRRVAEFYMRTGRPQQAEGRLSRIATGEVKAEADNLPWSRTNLALIWASRGGYRNIVAALVLLEKNPGQPEPTLEDQRVKAIAQAGHPQKQVRREAITTLEKVVREYRSSSPEDRFLLTKLYLADNQWSKATDTMRQLLASHGSEPRYVAAYIDVLLGRKEVGEAQLWVNRLKKLAAASWETASLEARTFAARGQYAEAIAALRGYTEPADAQPSDRTARMALAAAQLAALGRQLKGDAPAAALDFVRQAEQLYRDCADQRPEHQLTLAVFLAEQGRAEEAYQLLETAWRTSAPDAVGAAVVAMLAAAGSPQWQVERAEKVLQDALQEKGRPLVLLLVLADLESVLEKMDEAEALYREVLKTDPDNLAALNNLATLLAIRDKQVQESQSLIQRALEIGGPSAELLDSRALVLMACGQVDQAIVDLQAAADDTPGPTVYLHLARAYHLRKRVQAAEEALRKARQLGLEPEKLHPLDRAVYRELQVALK